MADEQLVFKILGDDSNFNKTMSSVNKSLLKVGKSVASATVKFAKWGAVGIAGATTAIVALTSKLGNTADGILDMASATGMSTDAIQEWGYISKIAGVNQGQLNKAMLNTGQSSEQFTHELKKLQAIKDPYERMRQGVEMYGARQWEAIAPILDTGIAIDDMKSKAQEAGAVMSGETLNGLNNFRIGMDTLKQSSESLLGTVLANFAPLLTDIANKFNDNLPAIQSFIAEGVEKLSNILAIIIPYIKNLISNIKELGIIDSIKNLFNLFLTIITDVGSFIISTVIPAILNLLKAIDFKSILDTSIQALQFFYDAIKVVYDFIANNWSLIEPIVVGVVGAFLIFQTVSAVMAIVTGVISAFGVAVAIATAPITLIIIAIVALIAIGYLLWKNWDVIKAWLLKLWEDIKAKWDSAISAIKAKISEFSSNIKSKFNEIKSGVIAVWNALWDNVRSKIANVISGIIGLIQKIKSGIVNTFNSIKSSVKATWDGLWNGIKSKISEAWNFIKSKASGIKSALANAFKFTIPKIKLPHISVTGKLSLAPPSVPKVSIKWYKKGGIFNSPTLLGGMNGVGEAGAEAVIPLTNQKYVKPFAQTIADLMGNNNGGVNITIQSAVVREDADINRIARQLQLEIDKRNRYKGVLA